MPEPATWDELVAQHDAANRAYQAAKGRRDAEHDRIHRRFVDAARRLRNARMVAILDAGFPLDPPAVGGREYRFDRERAWFDRDEGLDHRSGGG